MTGKKIILALVVVGFMVSPVYASVTKQVREDFARLVDVHRSLTRDFEVKKASVAGNPSFANQEAYTLSAKNLLVSLDSVWMQYWTILVNEVSDRRGFTDVVADDAINKLAQEITFLNDHAAAVKPLTSLDAVRAQAEFMSVRGSNYQPLAYSTLTTIKRARFAYASQQLEAFRLTLIPLIDQQILDPVVQEARKRGLEELGPRLAAAASTSATITQSDQYQLEHNPQEAYADWLERSSASYSELQQIYARLKELSQGIEL